jgi:REP element-mobilizing transposase RayT
MSQSLAKNLIHIIFSTKNRLPTIAPSVQEELKAYLVGTLNNLDSPSIETNCTEDHVHILCSISRNHSLASLLEELKKSSSRWVKGKGHEFQDFYWQAGYGAFSVSQSNLESVRTYIKDQEQHHRNATFQEEFRRFLERHQIEFDEKYVWA